MKLLCCTSWTNINTMLNVDYIAIKLDKNNLSLLQRSKERELKSVEI